MQNFIAQGKSGWLLEIWNYSQDKWSEDQADAYLRGLIAAVYRLSNPVYPRRAVTDAQLTGIYLIRYRRHFIFFRQLPGGVVGVINILHKSMDIPSKLKADLPSAFDTPTDL